MEAIMAILGGGATGLLGTVFGRVFGFFEKREERKFILEKYALDAEQAALERENELAIAQADADAKMLVSSYQHDSSAGIGSQWVIDTLRLVRPVITIMLWCIVFVVWCTTEEAGLQAQIINTILYCATAATLWWFGSRDKRK